MHINEETKYFWDVAYDWSRAGEEWSKEWGSSQMQWYGTVLPRIAAFLPVHTILEIGSGFGRWTEFLRNYCSNLIGVDYSDKCIQACKERFADCTNMSFFVNDGKSLDMIPDGTVDFIFSYDSLICVGDAIMSAYISQFSRKLKKNGVAFIEHSNVEEYSNNLKLQSRISRIPKLLGILVRLGILERILLYGRSPSMSAKKMRIYAEENDLQCISQEFYISDSKCYFLDCISIMVRNDSIWVRDNKIFKNTSLIKEAEYLAELSQLYDFRSRK